ncbi:MAG TPA: polyribonucleotide nucleotidyltransferase [Acidimicrobiales bacterium]|nr:polyribonucleotide nucleotidyltransferase [Acidimicrobiales bacterium]
MADPIVVSASLTGMDNELTFETGKLAFQSQGSVLARLGKTEVLVTANGARNIREGIDFFPLTVDVEERMYAAGRIPGSFFRREGRPTDLAILTCRLIDRPLRPSFADGYRNETQVVVTVMGVDGENPYDVVAINGASAALMLSGLPFEGPIGAVRIAWSAEGKWVPHPTYEQGDDSTFELVVAGRQNDEGDIAIMMVEAGGTEKAWELYQDGTPYVTEEVIAGGLEAAKTWIRESIDAQRELVAKASEAGLVHELEWQPQVDYTDEIAARVEAVGTESFTKVAGITVKAEREAAQGEAAKAVIETLLPEFPEQQREINNAAKALLKKIVRRRIVTEGARIDGRTPADIRPLSSEVGVLPTAHGSGLFQRGETQVLNVTTLGMPKTDQILDNLGNRDRKRYMHHYNMPPHANGETGRVGSPKRREIGHGLLAERALLPVVPGQDEFPYVLRLVSEVLASNGSTSMASVCSSTLSLMDAGVPIKAPVAGIAMGLVYAEGSYTTLTDILGAEDAFGDMDFKVAGTSEFVTALQLDTKIEGLPADVLASALQQAYEARTQILEVMHDAIAEPRDEVGETAPKIVSFEIPMDKIGEVIGPKGKVINAITTETGADVSVDDDGMVGRVSIGSSDKGAVEEARRQINLILNPPTAEVGQVYPGRVVNITKFGAFVNILPGRDGLLHISKIGGGKRIDRVEDVLDLGDEVEVRVDDVDPNGKVSLSLASSPPPAEGDGGGRGGRDRDRDRDRGERREASSGAETVSFEESFDAELRGDLGDLGPATAAPSDSRGDRGSRGGDRRRRQRR